MVKLRTTEVRFRPYSTDKIVPLLGCCDVRMRNNKDMIIKTRVYITEGEKESLLGKDDAMALGILKLNPDGDEPENVRRVTTQTPEILRCITPEILKPENKTGIVSGGKTQLQIDADMSVIADKHSKVLEGMGRAKVDPIHINMRNEMTPIAQGKRPIPEQFKEAVNEKLLYMKDNGLIEGPLPPGECTGWIHNMVITKKSWSTSEVRINIDTKLMNRDIVQTKIRSTRSTRKLQILGVRREGLLLPFPAGPRILRTLQVPHGRRGPQVPGARDRDSPGLGGMSCGHEQNTGRTRRSHRHQRRHRGARTR